MARRKARSAAASPQEAQGRQSTAEQESDHQHGDSDGDGDGDGGEATVPPFFDTTFSTHRVSPLYVGAQQLDQARLDLLAHRLRDTLVGDVVRGIQIGLEATDTPTGQVGPLRAVTFRWFRASDVLGDEALAQRSDGQSDSQLSDEQKHGLWIEMRHENAAYVALLLPGYSDSAKADGGSKSPLWTMQPEKPRDVQVDQSHFVHLPLLLLRMPQHLKAVIGDWLSTTFDCRVNKLTLGTRSLVSVWEGWIQVAGIPSNSADLVLTLAFNTPLARRDRTAIPDSNDDDLDDDDLVEPGLRTMEISLSASDLRRFLRAGKSVQKAENENSNPASWEHDSRERRRLAGPNVDDGWAWRRDKDAAAHPFTEALAQYLKHHMALNLFHPSVRVVQVSCGGFVLAQSRLKIIKPGIVTEDLSRAAWMFVMQLGERIRGDGMPSVT